MENIEETSTTTNKINYYTSIQILSEAIETLYYDVSYFLPIILLIGLFGAIYYYFGIKFKGISNQMNGEGLKKMVIYIPIISLIQIYILNKHDNTYYTIDYDISNVSFFILMNTILYYFDLERNLSQHYLSQHYKQKDFWYDQKLRYIYQVPILFGFLLRIYNWDSITRAFIISLITSAFIRVSLI